jgi:hypothetical protein
MAHERVNDLTLERYRLGELKPNEQAAVETALGTDPLLAGRLKALEASDRAILDLYPPHLMAGEITRRFDKQVQGAKPPARRPLHLAWKALPLLAAAWLVTVLFLPDASPLPRPPATGITPADITQTKGSNGANQEPRLVLYHKRSVETVSQLPAESLLCAGDLLQIAFVSGGARFGAILSIDGRGTVTLHHPPAETDSNVLAPSGRQILLQNAYELDDAPGFEHFYFITSSQPFSTSTLLQKVRSIAQDPRQIGPSLPIGPLFQQTSVLVRK